jgi:hypothetical protein
METNKEMAEYIYSILLSDRKVMWSWGFRKPTIVEGGLKFKVSGFIFKGWVQVTYNAGADLFDIKLITVTGVEKLSLDHVYFDELITVIDNYVERVDNYEDVVREKYFGGKEGFSS